MPSTMPSTALNGVVNSEAESEQHNGSVETTTTECQTDKVEKHVTFEDAIRQGNSLKLKLQFSSLSDSNLDPPLEDPEDPPAADGERPEE